MACPMPVCGRQPMLHFRQVDQLIQQINTYQPETIKQAAPSLSRSGRESRSAPHKTLMTWNFGPVDPEDVWAGGYCLPTFSKREGGTWSPGGQRPGLSGQVPSSSWRKVWKRLLEKSTKAVRAPAAGFPTCLLLSIHLCQPRMCADSIQSSEQGGGADRASEKLWQILPDNNEASPFPVGQTCIHLSARGQLRRPGAGGAVLKILAEEKASLPRK